MDINKNTEQYLYSFYWDCGRQGELRGLFKATPNQIKSLIDKEVYFGEVLGKHSEVYGYIEDGDIRLESCDQDIVARSVESGYNPIKYFTCQNCGDLIDLEKPVNEEYLCANCLNKSST